MIELTSFDTCRIAYIPERFVTSLEELVTDTSGRVYPFTRVHIENPADKYKYFVDVVESKRKVEQIIEEQKRKSAKPNAEPDGLFEEALINKTKEKNGNVEEASKRKGLLGIFGGKSKTATKTPSKTGDKTTSSKFKAKKKEE